MMHVEPYPNFYANLCVDGDKSITVRALLLSAVTKGVTKIINPLLSEDTLNAIKCVKQLGASVSIDKKNSVVTVCGREKIADNKRFYCGNSGTLARLLIGLLSGAGVTATVCGDKSLSGRPMKRVIDPLLSRGAKIYSKNGCLPIKIYPSLLGELNYAMPIDSAQVKSALLLSGLTSGRKTIVHERNFTRCHTERMLEYLGANVSVCGKTITLEKSCLTAREIEIFSDPSSAAYYLALGLLKGEVTVKNLIASPLRTAFIDKLRASGAKFDEFNSFEKCGEKVFSVTAYKSEIERFTISESEVPSLIDELPLLAVIACFNRGAEMHGVEELKVKESDRLQGIIDLIEKIGGRASFNGRTLTIESAENFNSFDFSSDDHRMTLCAHIAMLAGNGGNLYGENSVNVSFPSYFKNLKKNSLALIGSNVRHSKSGTMHKHVLSDFKLENFSYRCIDLKQEEIPRFFKKCPYKSINVTIPYKNTVCDYIKKQTGISKKANSVNFIFGGKGYSFDGEGLCLYLKSENVNLKGKKVLVYGVGGAGRSIAVSLIKNGATVFIKNRTEKKAQDFSTFINDKKLLPFNNEKCDILINATSERTKSLFLDEQILNAELVIDINYASELCLRDKCARLNVAFFDGLGMLFYQAYLADCKIADKKFDAKNAKKRFNEYKEKYENNCN